LRGRKIGRVARLAALVDVYDALTHNRPHIGARTPFEALKIMAEEMSGRLDMRMFRDFVRFLGRDD
jgi:HD-GYP domain-containing protein (c-di-GMP phosphodiesterase class II)